MEVLAAVFGQQNHLSTAQECARTLLIFAFALGVVRISGRRTFAKWSSLDTVVSVIAGSTLSRALTGNAPLWGTLAAMLVLFGAHWALAQLAARHSGLAAILEGRPITLGRAGQLDERARVRHSVSRSDVLEALHRKDLEEPSGTRLVSLEPNGTINVIKT
jgi:uncharacterized membrane protein YcaP (DUF421 family)